MYVVTVIFNIKPDYRDAFRAAMEEQARVSLEHEPDCHQFDVAMAADGSARYFLYELYTDKAAFEAHLETPHFKAFDAKVSSWVASKTVDAYDRVWPKG